MVYLNWYTIIPIPANAKLYVDQFQSLIKFEVLNPEALIQKFIDPDFDLQAFIMQSKEAIVSKDQATNPLNGMKMYIMMIAGGLVFLLLLCVLMIFKKFKAKIKVKIIGFQKKFFWNGFVRSIYISYIELVMQGFAILILVKKGKQSCSSSENVTLCTQIYRPELEAAIKECED